MAQNFDTINLAAIFKYAENLADIFKEAEE
jgi:hypothetical protein